MSDPGTYDRFEELEAGRLLGDLDDQEWREWNELAEKFSDRRDGSLELVAAAVEAEFASAKQDPLPPGLADRLRREAGGFSEDKGKPGNVVEGGFPEGILHSVRAAWAIAALLAALLVAVVFLRPGTPEAPPETVEAPLEKRARDLVTPAFEGVEAYGDMSGRVVWSDSLQEGYMELTNLEPNDPARNQYQLWIVDPERSAQPVDGGVFDVDSSGTVRVPINAKLAVKQPQAFVITLEKPGGVVVSSQETVVAISKVAA